MRNARPISQYLNRAFVDGEMNGESAASKLIHASGTGDIGIVSESNSFIPYSTRMHSGHDGGSRGWR